MPNWYTSINPNSRYDRSEFVERFKPLSKLENAVQTLVQDPHNLSAFNDVSKNTGSDIIYSRLPNGPAAARADADRILSEGLEAIARYTEHNFGTLLDVLDDESLLNLIANVPLQKTGREEHDKFVDIVNSYRTMQQIMKSGNPEARAAFVQRKVQGLSPGVREAVFFSGSAEYMDQLFGAYFNEAKKDFEDATHTNAGKLKKGFIRSRLKASIDKAKAEHDNADEEDKSDILDEKIRPHYELLARFAYPLEKKREED